MKINFYDQGTDPQYIKNFIIIIIIAKLHKTVIKDNTAQFSVARPTTW